MGPFVVRRDQPGSRAYLKLHLTRERKLPIHRDALRKRIQASNHLARYVLLIAVLGLLRIYCCFGALERLVALLHIDLSAFGRKPGVLISTVSGPFLVLAIVPPAEDP